MSEEKTKQNEPNVKPSTLFTRDNLEVLRGLESATFDLIYLDPPFNSNRKYNVFYKDRENKPVQEEAFRDIWTMDDVTAAEIGELASISPKLHSIIRAVGDSNGDSHEAYLTKMAVRLIELRRVLKPTGSIYLHCDPTMSHSLKLVMDTIFGVGNFRNEVIWKRTSSHNRARRFGPIHDVILFYSASSKYAWNRVTAPLDKNYVEQYYKHWDKRGRFRLSDLTGAGTRRGDSGEPWGEIDPNDTNRHWEVPPDGALPDWFVFPEGYAQMTIQERLDVLDAQGLIYWPKNPKKSKDPKKKNAKPKPQFKRYYGKHSGSVLQDMIMDIKPVQAGQKEQTPYPTQKPLALLRRLIEASSNEGDWVLDPFCGCATTCVAATELKRKWVGIDIAPLAVDMVKARLKNEIPLETQNVIARVDVPKRKSGIIRTQKETLKEILFGIQRGMCMLCLRRFYFEDMQVDHEIPRAQGGQDDDRNMQLLCAVCNMNFKGARTMAQASVRIRKSGIYKAENEPRLAIARRRLQDFRKDLDKKDRK